VEIRAEIRPSALIAEHPRCSIAKLQRCSAIRNMKAFIQVAHRGYEDAKADVKAARQQFG
jgi:hypothetical protein